MLVNTGRVADRILEPDTGGDTLHEILARGEFYGMQSFDQSLFGLHRAGLVSRRDALGAATNPHDLGLALQRAGLASSRAGAGAG